jgi:DNA-binding CsgD family transcriptional regulator
MVSTQVGVGVIGGTEAVLWASLSADIACRVLVIGPDDRLRDVNAGAEHYFGLTRDQIVGQSLLELYPAQVRVPVCEWLCAARATRDDAGPACVAHHVYRGHHWRMAGRAITWRGEPGCVLCVGQIVSEPTPVGELMTRALRLADRAIGLDALAVLSDRELEVAMLISGGKTDLEVAQALHRSLRTVHSHRASLGRKLGLQRRAELTHFMAARGMVACSEQVSARSRGAFEVPNGIGN